MKRRVTMFRKDKTVEVPGVAKGSTPIVYVGMDCPQVGLFGGGRVADMELVANGTAILIRKVDAKGQPLHDFGLLSPGAGPAVTFEGDWTIFPLSKTLGCVGRDVPEEQQEKPAQQQTKGK